MIVATMTTDTQTRVLHEAIVRVLEELRTSGIADPLSATVSVGALVRDLYRAANLPVPIGLAVWTGDTTATA
jgi:hypothetical protein